MEGMGRMESKINLSSKKLKREKRTKKILRIILLIILLILLISYFVIGIIYNKGNFTITLDRNLYFDRGLIIYDDPEYKVYRSELYAEAPQTFENISHQWLPDDLDDQGGGSHNGDNYLAYTFYIENIGSEIADYWSEVVIDDVIKDVDEAVRIRIYRNGEEVTYAKASYDGTPEQGTEAFENEEIVVRTHIEDFRPGELDRYTIVLWIEGTDPECTDNILGGEFKVHMDFNSEYLDEYEEN